MIYIVTYQKKPRYFCAGILYSATGAKKSYDRIYKRIFARLEYIQPGIFAFFKVRYEVATLHGTVTRKHRQRVATSKKWRTPAVQTRRHFAAVFACWEYPNPDTWEVPNPLRYRENIFEKTCFTFGKTPARRRSSGERDNAPLSTPERG